MHPLRAVLDRVRVRRPAEAGLADGDYVVYRLQLGEDETFPGILADRRFMLKSYRSLLCVMIAIAIITSVYVYVEDSWPTWTIPLVFLGIICVLFLLLPAVAFMQITPLIGVKPTEIVYLDPLGKWHSLAYSKDKPVTIETAGTGRALILQTTPPGSKPIRLRKDAFPHLDDFLKNMGLPLVEV